MLALFCTRLIGIMVWTDKGPKYLVMSIIASLALYMFYALMVLKSVNKDALRRQSNWKEWSNERYAMLKPVIDPLGQVYDEDSPELVNLIGQKFLIEPSKEGYALENRDPSMGQTSIVRKILHDKV